MQSTQGPIDGTDLDDGAEHQAADDQTRETDGQTPGGTSSRQPGSRPSGAWPGPHLRWESRRRPRVTP